MKELGRYLGDPLLFIREQIVLSDGRRVGDAISEDPWIEMDVLDAILRRGESGLPSATLVYVELPRGHWKTGGIAAVALTEALLNSSTDVVCAASDEQQAGIILENVSGYIARNSLLRASVKERKGEFLVPARGSRIRVISSDVPSAWGLGGTHRRFRVFVDELAQWPDRGEELWVALVSATGKTPDAQTVVISNAGYDRERSWQWKIREQARTNPEWARLVTTDAVLASWISDEWIEQMRVTLPPSAFDRVILNRWVAQSGDFITRAQWRACVDDRQPATGAVVDGLRQPQYAYRAGLDLGLTKDRTALSVVHREGERIILDELQVFEGSRREPVSIAAVEAAVLDLAERYPGVELTCDPWQLRGSVERLRSRMTVAEYTFSAPSLAKLSSVFYNSVSTTRLRVFDDAELEAEVLGLRVVQTPSGWKFDHAAGRYSDRVVSIALALQSVADVPDHDLHAAFLPWGRFDHDADDDLGRMYSAATHGLRHGMRL